MRRVLPTLSILLTLGLVVVGCTTGGDTASGSESGATSSSASPTVQPASTSTGESWLFVLEALAATATPADDGSTTLTLTDVRDPVVAFTDRPDRSATLEPLSDFVARWEERGFSDTPPNAAVVADTEVVVLELTDPRWDGGSNSLTLTSLPLDSDAVAGRDATTDELPVEMGATTLFVDSASDQAFENEVQGVFTYTGTGTPAITLNDLLATSLDEWSIEMEGSAKIVGTSNQYGENPPVITITGLGADVESSASASFVPRYDGVLLGSVTGVGDGTLTGQIFFGNKPGPKLNLTDGDFTLESPSG